MNKHVAYTEKLGINFLKNDAMPENDFTSKAHEGVKKFTTSSTFDGSRKIPLLLTIWLFNKLMCKH